MGELLGSLFLLAIILAVVALLAIIGKRISKPLSLTRRKCWLIAHILFVILYFSGLWGTLMLTNITTTMITDKEQVHAAHLFSKYADWFMIIPGAFGSLLTGLWLSIRTPWGLTKHRWVIVKIVGNIGAILYGSTLMRIWFDQTVALSSLGINPLQNPAYIHNRQMLILGTIISLGILTFLLVISYLKPWGKSKSPLGI